MQLGVIRTADKILIDDAGFGIAMNMACNQEGDFVITRIQLRNHLSFM